MEKIKYWCVSYWQKDEIGFSTISKNFYKLEEAIDFLTNHKNHKFTVQKFTEVVTDDKN